MIMSQIVSRAGLRLALVCVAALAMTGCDGRTEAEPAVSADRQATAFEEGLKGCAASAETLGEVWVGKPYAGLETYLAANPPADVASVRVIRPDTAVTRDYRIDRLNLSLDDQDVVTKLYCG